jgi:cyclopropane-fatty-acyl-phospholipid synthase
LYCFEAKLYGTFILRNRLKFRTRDRDRVAVQHHYDTGNAFYKLWLDPQMVYSCAYFEHPQMSLEEAQAAKLDRICRKLKLSSGETLLDIGCGWGALMHWAVARYGVKAHGITLSEEQLVYNQQRIAEAGLEDSITVEVLDYRDLPAEPRFNKIVSVGMVEHVGLQNYPAYFQHALAALKPGGLFLNHGIASGDVWNQSSIGEQFIDRYIFPDSQLTPVSTQLAVAEANGWEIVDVDGWRLHYAKTLRCWVENFTAAFDQISEKIGERQAHLWRIYLIGCALSFENNYMGIYQTLLRRKADQAWDLPMTRSEWLC